MYNSYSTSIANSFQQLYAKLGNVIPNIIGALIILIVGWLIAIFLGGLVYRILVAIKIDTLANRLGLDRLSARTGRRLSISRLGEWLVKWFFLIATFITATNVLGLNQVSEFLYASVFPYFGNVIIAVAILLIGMVAANFLADLVQGTLAAGQLKSSSALAAVTRWSIVIFAIIAALAQLRVATAFLQTLVTGVVFMLALAGGLAFGLGGRDHAKKVLDKIEEDLTRRM